MSDKPKDKYVPKHKTANIVFLCIFVLLAISSACIDPEVPASGKDLFFYRFSGAMLFLPIILGLLVNLDVFGVKKYSPLFRSEKNGHRVLCWFLIAFLSFFLFGILRSFTSDEFEKALEEAENTPETEYTAPAPDGESGDTGSEGYSVSPKSGSAHVASPDAYGSSPNVLTPKAR